MPETTYIKAITRTLAAAMREDPRVFVLGEDVAEGGPYTATAGLADEFGTARVVDTPISEAAITGVAIGAAQSGMGRCSRSCSSTSSRWLSTSS
jgi:acetoin:2,6-dichlorophenolindophenol oxidoreductase subunit beta